MFQETKLKNKLFEEIYNIGDNSDLKIENHLRTMRRVSLFGRKEGPTMNMIISCHPDCRRVLIDSGLCYLGWNACRVRDYLGATRCFKCHACDHVSKNCTQEKITCQHCATLGHDYEDCPKKTLSAECATCSRLKKHLDHSTGDRNCPACKAAIEWLTMAGNNLFTIGQINLQRSRLTDDVWPWNRRTAHSRTIRMAM